MKIKEIEKFEEDLRKEINRKYEEFAKENIGRYYRYKHKNEDRYFGDHDYTVLLYIHTIEGRSLSAIRFDDIDIQRHGYLIDLFVKGNWEKITKEEFMKELQYYEELFHFKEIFEK